MFKHRLAFYTGSLGLSVQEKLGVDESNRSPHLLRKQCWGGEEVLPAQAGQSYHLIARDNTGFYAAQHCCCASLAQPSAYSLELLLPTFSFFIKPPHLPRKASHLESVSAISSPSLLTCLAYCIFFLILIRESYLIGS